MSRIVSKSVCCAAIASALTLACAKSERGASPLPSSPTGVAEAPAAAAPVPAADPASSSADTGGAAATRPAATSTVGEEPAAAGIASEHASESQAVGRAPGQLTAGDWDDNLNDGFFRSYLSSVRSGRPDLPAVSLDDRVTIRVTGEGGSPVRHALVTVRHGEDICFSAPTGADGRLLFFPAHDCPQGRDAITVTAARSAVGSPPVTLQAPRGDSWTVVLPGTDATARRALDLALLVDATGSMGDEIGYLQEEIRGIAESVRAGVPDVSLRFSLVVYRDEGDEYVTRVFPFTGDLDAFRRDLSAQHAGGGGDYPEAVDQGITALDQLDWRSGEVTRVAFLIGDAPPHTDRAAAYLEGVDRLRRRGVHVYPIGASGVGDEAEYLFRVTAALTQARYLFLTDDSGIGNSHAEPHIPCYSVQHLDDLLRRMIVLELTGESVKPRSVLRTVGQPVDGRCALSGGRVALIAR